MCVVTVHITALGSTSLHRFQAAAVFYPIFYPKRHRSGVEMLYLLVTTTNWSGHPECVTSLPSWWPNFERQLSSLEPKRPSAHLRGLSGILTRYLMSITIEAHRGSLGGVLLRGSM